MLYLCTYADFGGLHRTQIGIFEADSCEAAIEKMWAEVQRLCPDRGLFRSHFSAAPVGKALSLPTPKTGCGR